MKFSELVRLLEENGFRLIQENGSKRFYKKENMNELNQIDYHGSKKIPTGTCNYTNGI